MEMRRVGNSGLKVSALGLGCNNFGVRLDEAASTKVVFACLDQGVTLFDTADVYPMGNSGASEEILGKALGSRRSDIVLATKFGMAMDKEGRLKGGSRKYIIEAVEASLTRLGTDRIDLLQFHRPDPDTPIDETLRALDDLIKAGKVRYIGCSNFAAWQTVEAEYLTRELGLNRFIASQELYSLVSRGVEADVIPVCKKYGLGLLPFFPLASGVLTGKYTAGGTMPEGTRLTTSKPLADIFLTDANLDLAAKLTPIAEQSGKELVDLAFAWLLRDAVVPSVIAGASTPAQVERNAIAAAWVLNDDEITAVDDVLNS